MNANRAFAVSILLYCCVIAISCCATENEIEMTNNKGIDFSIIM